MASKKKDEERKEKGTLGPESIEELRASSELLSLFMRHSPVYAYIKEVTSTESRLVQASDNYQRMLGSSSLDIVGKTMEELFPPEFAAKIIADDWAVVTNGNVLQVEKDMDDRSYISVKFPFVHGDKNMLAGYMFDITERKQADAKLRDAENKIRESEDKLRKGEGKLRDAEVKLQEIEGERRAGEDKLREIEGKLREAENKLREGGDRLQEGEAKLQEVGDKLREGEAKLQEVGDKLQESETKLQEVGDKVREGESRQREVGDKLREGEEALRKVEDRLRAGEEALRKVEDRLRAGEAKLREIEEKLQAGEQKLRTGEEGQWVDEGKLREAENRLLEGEKKQRASEDKLRKIEDKLRADREKMREEVEALRKGEEALRAGEDRLRASEEKLRRGEEALRKDRETPRAKGATPASLEEKEALREVHNHVKNNMSSIIALMEMQRKMPGKPQLKLLAKPGLTDAGLSAMEKRIESIALIHERLYQSQNPARVDCQDYLDALVSHLRTSLDVPQEFVCSVDAAGVALKLDAAVPVGIIVNELVTNAFKYAFPKNQPQFGADKCEIKVSMERRNNEYTLSVEDNGTGLPKMPVLSKTPTLGLRLVRMLGVDQLGGRLTVNRTKGTRFILKFNVRE